MNQVGEDSLQALHLGRCCSKATVHHSDARTSARLGSGLAITPRDKKDTTRVDISRIHPKAKDKENQSPAII